MIDAAIAWGIQDANSFIQNGGLSGGSFYYGQMQRELCTFLNATLVRCPLFMWFEAIDQDAALNTYVTREIFELFVFIEDLGTAVGFNPTLEPPTILDMDQSRPYYMLCSTYYAGVSPCPPDRFPVAYPPVGPPNPL